MLSPPNLMFVLSVQKDSKLPEFARYFIMWLRDRHADRDRERGCSCVYLCARDLCAAVSLRTLFSQSD